jgi:effector-binding domain-containing protein
MRKLIGTIICGMCLTVFGQSMPSTQTTGEFSNITIGEMKVEDLQGFTYLHLKKMTTMNQIGRTITADIQNLIATAKANHIEHQGPLTIFMHGVSDSLNQPFELQVGFKVPPETVAPAGYEVSVVPTTKTAVVIYSGPMMQVRLAYGKLYSGVFGAGMSPTKNIRESVLYYEGIDSINNVLLAGVELE